MRALAALLLVGCNAAASTHREPDEYTGCGGDEQYRTFDTNESATIVDDTKAPRLVSPASGMTVPFSAKAILRWNIDASMPGQNDGDVPYLDGPTCQACCPQFTTGSLTSLHLPPISGDEYDLQFTVDGAYVWRLVTTLQEWTPSDDLWTSWKGHGVSVKIIRMSVDDNTLATGPFTASTPFSFSVGS